MNNRQNFRIISYYYYYKCKYSFLPLKQMNINPNVTTSIPEELIEQSNRVL